MSQDFGANYQRLSDPTKQTHCLAESTHYALNIRLVQEFKARPPIESYAVNYEASSALAIPHTLPDITKMETVYADQLEKTARSQGLGRKRYHCNPSKEDYSTITNHKRRLHRLLESKKKQRSSVAHAKLAGGLHKSLGHHPKQDFLVSGYKIMTRPSRWFGGLCNAVRHPPVCQTLDKSHTQCNSAQELYKMSQPTRWESAVPLIILGPSITRSAFVYKPNKLLPNPTYPSGTSPHLRLQQKQQKPALSYA
ncbi:hypothetical protein NA56DRAFT_756686 [Hyaloscypha hepaticicola]|uniref:Uncharacterized protein n=1 Tax=Hyaloscypha hepaticicola TaxID=2082293 RepID=A0A2J6PEA0_9HELO|nr:hypothetical protein NA56DRAFT_756686 [Hyaloscypha hepaticicola]